MVGQMDQGSTGFHQIGNSRTPACTVGIHCLPSKEGNSNILTSSLGKAPSTLHRRRYFSFPLPRPHSVNKARSRAVRSSVALALSPRRRLSALARAWRSAVAAHDAQRPGRLEAQMTRGPARAHGSRHTVPGRKSARCRVPKKNV